MARFILIVLDSVGIGELPDASLYNDQGSNTLANTAKAVGGLTVPNLERLGLGNIHPIMGVKKQANPQAAYGKMNELSPGKDTTTGHWEMAGIVLKQPFPTYPNGFPAEIITAFSTAIEREILGNIAASGTEIIKELGEQHLKSGAPIVYTSADSVFQIAAHERIVPPNKLYQWCKIAREILVDQHAVGRVIARPFRGEVGKFWRTENRRDFSLAPVDTTILDYLAENSYDTVAIGKIKDVFVNRGITRHLAAGNNSETGAAVIEAINTTKSGLIFANFVDFDSLWGHRNDVKGYAQGLESFDKFLPNILDLLAEDDVLCITADHGCDPTTESTDHSREYVPLLLYGQRVKPVDLGIRETFADVAQSICEFYKLPQIFKGKSFMTKVW